MSRSPNPTPNSELTMILNWHEIFNQFNQLVQSFVKIWLQSFTIGERIRWEKKVHTFQKILRLKIPSETKPLILKTHLYDLAGSSPAVILGPRTALMVVIKGWWPSLHPFFKSSKSNAQTVPLHFPEKKKNRNGTLLPIVLTYCEKKLF